MNTTNQIRFNHIARTANKEMKASGLKNNEAHKRILDAYEAIVKTLNFTRIQLMCEIAEINGQVRSRL